MSASKIEWTDETWNPTVGCARVSAGCERCYAERMTHRLGSNPKTPIYHGLTRETPTGSRFTGEVRTAPDRLDQPLRWRKPRRVFVNSMSDLFHEDVPNEFIAAVFGVMAATPQHTYQILTKRPERMVEWFRWVSDHGEAPQECLFEAMDAMGLDEPPGDGTPSWPLPNVWLGVSVENQEAADERIPHLLQTPAAVRFLSCEPLLGVVDLDHWLHLPNPDDFRGDPLAAFLVSESFRDGTGDGVRALDWVIIGGESGPGARPMDVQWARSLLDQCQGAGVPAFVKQLGARPHDGVVVDGGHVEPCWIPTDDPKGGDINEFPDDLRVREVPDAEKKPGELLRSFLTDPLSYIPHPDQVDFVSVDDLLADLDARPRSGVAEGRRGDAGAGGALHRLRPRPPRGVCVLRGPPRKHPLPPHHPHRGDAMKTPTPEGGHMSKTKTRPVIITTERRGVFHGQLESYEEATRRAVLTDAVMAIYWGTTQGLFQLAATGPTDSSKISSVAPRIELELVECVIDVSEEAEAAWTRATS